MKRPFWDQQILVRALTVAKASGCSHGATYLLLTAQPDNRCPLTWERIQVDVLLLEQVPFICPWTQKALIQPD